MPTIPLSLPFSPLLPDEPFGSLEELYEVLPGYMRESANDVADAIMGGLFDAVTAWAADAAARAAETDEAYADGSGLDFVGMSSREMPRQLGELDDEYRARMLGDADADSPAAMLAAVKAITSRFYPDAEPYYWERSADDPTVYAAAGRNVVQPDGSIANAQTDGWYPSSSGPEIVAADRRYAARGLRAPYGLGWNGTDGTTTNAPGVWGHAVLAIPPFPLPGTTTPEDFLGYVQGSAPLIDAGGNLTAAAEALLAAAPSVPLYAHAVDGRCVYAQASDSALVADRVRALVETRVAWPVQVSILLDPELV